MLRSWTGWPERGGFLHQAEPVRAQISIIKIPPTDYCGRLRIGPVENLIGKLASRLASAYACIYILGSNPRQILVRLP
jgi:hypothetical protein